MTGGGNARRRCVPNVAFLKPAIRFQSRDPQVFSNWINNKLKERIQEGKVPPVLDVNLDLKDGYVLYHLLEARRASRTTRERARSRCAHRRPPDSRR